MLKKLREPVQKKKCGKFHTWAGGGPDRVIFHTLKK